MRKKARKSTPKKKSKPKLSARLDATQLALTMVEKIIGGKLSNGMKLKN